MSKPGHVTRIPCGEPRNVTSRRTNNSWPAPEFPGCEVLHVNPGKNKHLTWIWSSEYLIKQSRKAENKTQAVFQLQKNIYIL